MPSVRSIQDALWHFLCPRAPNTSRREVCLGARISQSYTESGRALDFGARPASTSTRLLLHTICRTSNFKPSKPLLSSLRPIASQRCLHGDARSLLDFSQTRHTQHQAPNIAQTYAQLYQQARMGQYTKVQELAERLVQEYGEKPNGALFEALILANTDCWHGSANEVARLLEDMAEEGIEPDSAVLHSALQALAIHPDYLLRSYILHELRHRWISLTLNGWHDVVVGLIRDRQLEKALNALEQMQEDGVTIYPWLYDMIIYTLCSAEEFDEAHRLLEHRLESGELLISPNLWAHALDSASRALHYPLTVFAFKARVQTSYLNPSSGVCINILSTAARHGDTRLATSILHILSRRSGSPIQLHHYEALLETYVASKDLRGAFTLLAIMKTAAHPPTEASTRPIFTYLCKSRYHPKKAHKVLYSIRDEGRTIPVQAINVLIESYNHHQDLSAALELYKSMQTLSSGLTPDTATFNALLRGCKRKNVAMFLASEMVALKIAPNALTYDRLLLVCLDTDEGLDNVWRYFKEMKAAGWSPRGGTANSLARKACELGDRRVWDLLEDEQGKGLTRKRIDDLVKTHWKKLEESVKKGPEEQECRVDIKGVVTQT